MGQPGFCGASEKGALGEDLRADPSEGSQSSSVAGAPFKEHHYTIPDFIKTPSFKTLEVSETGFHCVDSKSRHCHT